MGKDEVKKIRIESELIDKNVKKDLKKIHNDIKKFEVPIKGVNKQLNQLNAISNKTKKYISGLNAVSKKLRVSMYSTEKMFKQAGVSTKKLGFHYENMDQFQKKAGKNVKKLGAQFNTFGKVMNMDTDAFIGFIKAGYKFSGTGPELAAGFRMATQGLHKFKMEFLSVMFFGMQMKSIGKGLLGPAMQMYGITDMWTVMLQTVMIPIMNILYPILMKFMMWLINLPEGAKLAIGAIATLMVVVGGLMFGISQLGLFLGAIPDKIGIFAIGMSKMAGAIRHPILAMKGLYVSFKDFLIKMWMKAKVGFGSISKVSEKSGKSMGKSWSKSMKGMIAGTTTGIRGIIAAMGPIGVALAVITVAVTLFALAWKGNWFGIRQKTGEFVRWFSGVYDAWIKPVFLHMGTGLIILKNVFFFVLNNLSGIWSFTWLTMQSTAYRIWNIVLSGVEVFINGLTLPFKALYGAVGSVGAALGKPLPEFPSLNLNKYKISTKEVDENLKKVGDNLKTNLVDMSKNTVSEVEGLSNTLDSFTGIIDESGKAMIESGNQMDAESAKKEKNKSITDKLKDSLGGLNQGIKNIIPGMNLYNDKIYDNDEAIKTATKGLGDMNNVINNDWAESMNFQNTKLGEVSSSFDSATSAVNKYIASLKRIPSGKASSSGGSSGSWNMPEWWTPTGTEVMTPEGGMTMIPGFQSGGIFTKPVFGMIGENGPEAVVPLDKFKGLGTTIHVHNTYNISGVSSKEDIERMIEESNTKLVDDLKSMLR